MIFRPALWLLPKCWLCNITKESRSFSLLLNWIELLTSQTKTRDRKLIYHDLESGMFKILVGTHALLEDKVRFKKLGIVVIDEQHRFGVGQRAKLWGKTKALFIFWSWQQHWSQRTLAMSLYGDLDISIIDELPPGRKEIKTIHVRDFHRMQLYEFMRKEIALGRQIYSLSIDRRKWKTWHRKSQPWLSKTAGILSWTHIQDKRGPWKNEGSRQSRPNGLFCKGLSHIMVATTVIEVGVNVPNASVMVIENAERFGLSQLHQLRGRVGRGSDQSYCMLMTADRIGKVSAARIKIMCDTNDGFKIAQADLEIRGPEILMAPDNQDSLSWKWQIFMKTIVFFKQPGPRRSKYLKDPTLENPSQSPTERAFVADWECKILGSYQLNSRFILLLGNEWHNCGIMLKTSRIWNKYFLEFSFFTISSGRV